jgi:HEAT repeat protein
VPVCPEESHLDTEEEFLGHLRTWASGAIAASGTERAIHALATGEGFDQDRLRHCPFLLSIAVYRKCGIERIPDRIEDLDQETQEAWQAAWEDIESRYGTREEITQRLESASSDPQPPNQARARITEAEVLSLAEEHASSGEQGAVVLAERYGHAPFEHAIALLDTELSVPVRGFLCAWLGKIGDPRAVPKLIEYSETTLPERVAKDEYHARIAAMRALGCIGNDAALDYLFRLLTEDYWVARKDQPKFHAHKSAEKTRLALREHAMHAIAYSGVERALEAFTTGEGIPEDLQTRLEWHRKVCARSMARREGVPYKPGEIPPRKQTP